MLNRRSLLAGLGLTLAAPAIIRTPGLLMPVRRIVPAGITYTVSYGRDVIIFTPSSARWPLGRLTSLRNGCFTRPA